MLLSLGLIFTFGLIIGELFGKLHLPKFLGMILTGILLASLQLISDDILSISSELRTIALVVILLRAGLSLDISDLKKIGRPAILLSFIPALLELLAVIIFAPIFFDISLMEAAILGSVLAAVSPAVIVPKMIKLIELNKGHKKRIPHMILASASVDDIFIIVLFTAFIEMYKTGNFEMASIALIPIAIVSGILLGIILGYILSIFFAKFRVRDTVKLLIILAISFFVLSFEEAINTFMPLSGLLSIMVLGITFLNKAPERAKRVQVKFDKVWVFAELVLFTLVGAAVDVKLAISAGLFALILIGIELSFRSIGVFISLVKTSFSKKERSFVAISYIPKATVQAAIGAIPLSIGVPNGELILAIAVLSILVTAPLGAILIDVTYKSFIE